MSTGGANSCSGSPRSTTTRRRVADFVDAEKAPINPAASVPDDDEKSDEEPTSSHVHNHSHHHHHHPLIKFVLLRRRMCLCVPEAWLLRIEDVVCWTASFFVQSVRSGWRITGRRILGILMMMVVVSLFLKVSFMSVHMDWIAKRSSISSNRNYIVQYKDDLTTTQKIVSEIDESTTSSHSSLSGGSVMPTRVLEKYPVRQNYQFFMLKLIIGEIHNSMGITSVNVMICSAVSSALCGGPSFARQLN